MRSAKVIAGFRKTDGGGGGGADAAAPPPPPPPPPAPGLQALTCPSKFSKFVIRGGSLSNPSSLQRAHTDS